MRKKLYLYNKELLMVTMAQNLVFILFIAMALSVSAKHHEEKDLGAAAGAFFPGFGGRSGMSSFEAPTNVIEEVDDFEHGNQQTFEHHSHTSMHMSPSNVESSSIRSHPKFGGASSKLRSSMRDNDVIQHSSSNAAISASQEINMQSAKPCNCPKSCGCQFKHQNSGASRASSGVSNSNNYY